MAEKEESKGIKGNQRGARFPFDSFRGPNSLFCGFGLLSSTRLVGLPLCAGVCDLVMGLGFGTATTAHHDQLTISFLYLLS